MDILPFGGYGGPERTEICSCGTFPSHSLALLMHLAIWMSFGMMVTRFA